MGENERSTEDVEKIMGFAKLESKDVKSTVQCFSFADNLDNDRFKLMQIDDAILSHLEQGQRLTVRGLKSDLAVLCTDNKTYQLRQQETSNSLLLLADCQVPSQLADDKPLQVAHKQVCALKYEYYELQTIQPRLKHLKEILEKNMYNGEEYENDNDHQDTKYTYCTLLAEVQASEAEVLQGLHELEACKIDGYYRLLSFDLLSLVLTHIMNLIEEKSWSYDAIPVAECCDVLHQLFRRDVIFHILKSFTGESAVSVDVDTKWKISEDKICCFFAEMILRPVAGFKLDEFLSVWQEAIPEGFQTSLCQLQGMVLVDRDSMPVSIRYYPVSELPENVEDRFNKLFATKQKWTMDEITPYIKDMATDKLSVGALLTKFARASTVNGIKMYNSKRPLR